MHRVGLCMIVKDEAHVIERCLSSVRDHIDHWVIVDTGSTDGTPDMVRELLRDAPGFLLERPWRDFGHNRTEALEAARSHAEYSFVIDADEELVVEPGFRWPELTVDSVHLLHRAAATAEWRARLVANRLPWRYVGVLHEYLDVAGAQTFARIDGAAVVDHFDGGRSVGLSTVAKYARDARTLEAALIDEPDNPRYQYYLARSHRLSDQPDAALAAYRRRAEMGGSAEEVWDSLLWIGRLLERDAPADQVIAAYRRAWVYRPDRAESLACLARFCRGQGRFALARSFAARALQIPAPTDDSSWVEEAVYEWACLDEFAVASYWTGDFQDSAAACRELLEKRRLPESERARVLENLAFAERALAAAEAAPRVPAPAQPSDEAAVSTSRGPSDPLWALLSPRRRTAVVDVGADPIDGDPPYVGLSRQGLCTVIGFEPNPEAVSRLEAKAGPGETYLPWAIGDGGRHTLHECAAPGMSSLLPPDSVCLQRFGLFAEFGSVVATREVQTRRLDDLPQLGSVDLLTVDVQGAELAVLRSGRLTLRVAVAVHTKVSFVALYQGQPTFGELDAELRSAGFVPHALLEVKRWPLASLVFDDDPRRAINQVLEAEVLYIRDLARPGALTDEQLKHLALIAHHCYGSFDLAAECLRELSIRGSIPEAAVEMYCRILADSGVSVSVVAPR